MSLEFWRVFLVMGAQWFLLLSCFCLEGFSEESCVEDRSPEKHVASKGFVLVREGYSTLLNQGFDLILRGHALRFCSSSNDG